MVREATQEDGRIAAFFTKRWLESSTYIDLPWNSYKHDAMCRVECLDGLEKGFDLVGLFLDDQTQIVVENKGVGSAGDQWQEFRELLAIAYSSTVRERDLGRDTKRVFAWVTTHPFGYSQDWLTLSSPDQIRAALQEFPKYLAGRTVDNAILIDVAARIWVLVFSEKQKRLLLQPDEVSRVHALLKRKGDEL